jgi:hypothetical protein
MSLGSIIIQLFCGYKFPKINILYFYISTFWIIIIIIIIHSGSRGVVVIVAVVVVVNYCILFLLLLVYFCMYIYMYVCMYACMHACMHAYCIYTWINKELHQNDLRYDWSTHTNKCTKTSLSLISLLKDFPNMHFGTSTLPSSGGSWSLYTDRCS